MSFYVFFCAEQMVSVSTTANDRLFYLRLEFHIFFYIHKKFEFFY